MNHVTEIVCEQLNENPEERPAESIAYHVQTYGAAAVAELVVQARRVFAGDGLPTAAGGRRTLGGCYFHMAKRRGWVTEPRKIRRLLAVEKC
jgi:hypothetical protein